MLTKWFSPKKQTLRLNKWKSFMIRSAVIRWGIFLSTLIIVTIIIFQLVWLKKTYRFEQKEFDRNIVKVIRGLYEDLDMNTYYSTHLNELIENPEPHLYMFRLHAQVTNDTLKSYLQYELEDFGVFTDCQYGLYDPGSAKFIYTDVLTSVKTNKKILPAIPHPARPFTYVALYFPNRQGYILSQINIWIISSVLMMLILILFSAAIFYFYKQKFLAETQKDFVHNFAHEFKTPVSVISLAADTILDKTNGKNDKLSTYAGIIRYQGNYLASQIEKLLQFAYTESRHLQLDKGPVDMHRAINEAINHLSPLIEERNALLKLELNAEDPVVQADKNYMLIVLMNLIDNAIKYSRHPEIIITTKRQHNSFSFSIQDNGIGIEKKQLHKIFKKFYRVYHGEVYSSRGFGIGLSFVKTILEAHHGGITAESVVGNGSIFKVQLNA
jgi:two-component system phosphate regulon sensor histidine kinase PhoR